MKDYKNSISWNVGGSLDGGKRKVYITLMDVAGNKTKKTIEYKVYEECTNSNLTSSTSDVTSCPSCGNAGTTHVVRTTAKDSYTGTVCSTSDSTVACNIPTCGPPDHIHVVGYVGTSIFTSWGAWYDACGSHTTYRKGYCKICYDHGVTVRCLGNGDCLSGYFGGWLDGKYNCPTSPYYPIIVPD